MNYIIPTLHRPTLERTVTSILNEDVHANVLVESHGKSAGENRNLALSKIDLDKPWILFVDDDDYLLPGFLKELDTNYDVTVLRMKQQSTVIPRMNDSTLRCGNVGINFAVKTSFWAEHKIFFDSLGHEEDWRFLKQLLGKTTNVKVTKDIYYMAPVAHHLQ